MLKFRVEFKLTVNGTIEVEAADEEQATEMVEYMDTGDLFNDHSTHEMEVEVVDCEELG